MDIAPLFSFCLGMIYRKLTDPAFTRLGTAFMKSSFLSFLLLLILPFAPLGCVGDAANSDFEITATTPSAALMAVHGTSKNDVWMVGADDGQGPLTLHLQGDRWVRRDPGVRGDFWWVHALSEDQVFFAGSDANIVLFDGDHFTRQETPGLGRHTVYGLWGSAPNDVYAVGAVAGRNGFIWHYNGDDWRELELPAGLPQDANRDTPALLKVSGRSPEDVWIVGDRGVLLRGNAHDGFSVADSGTGDRLFTVHCSSDEAVVVGGNQSGVLLKEDGRALRPLDTGKAGILQGAHVGENGSVWLTGQDGIMFQGRGQELSRVDPGIDFSVESLHAVWTDPSGGVWAVGGSVLSGSLEEGLAIHLGPAAPRYEETIPDTPPPPQCPPELVDPSPDGSMARRWNEQLLNSVRRDLPRPTVHARNLYHHSLALWDIWAAYDESAQGVLFDEKIDSESPDADRAEAMAYASYRLLKARYENAVGGEVSVACYNAFMEHLNLDPKLTSSTGNSPSALGNRVANLVLDHFSNDGSNEDNDYTDPAHYTPPVPPLIVDEPGTVTTDPLIWQQIVLAEAVTQNGILEGAGVRDPVGTHWGQVTPFALERSDPDLPYFDTEMPPTQYDEVMRDAIVEVIEKSAELDHEDGVMIDISPGAYGNNSLGTNDGTGHQENPVTGQPYEPNLVPRGDFTRILAEFWADGPDSETPPGHWNTLANDVSDSGLELRLFGQGEELNRLAWDSHLYLALNGALHDAAIAAWELKRHYESARPITLIRYFGSLGQRTDPALPSYHEDGLPLIPGVIELITEQSSAPGARHEHLARYVGELAVYSWRGEPGDRETEIGGIDWIRAIEWLPYQRRTFVTPAFPGYVSGHSTFSRAGAEVLATLTGDPFFPGGLGTYSFEPGYLVFEYGPSVPVQLQWGTYYDAADQAGQSRLWGGIHITHDDMDGRIVGAEVGRAAIDLARHYYEGSAN